MSCNPIRVLYVNGGTMDLGGISTYMMNYYRHIDRKRVQIDFIVHGTGGIFDDEISANGGIVYHVPTKKDDFLENKREIFHILKSGNYQIIHSHMDGMNGMILKTAYKCGIPCRISHSHNTAHLTSNLLKIRIHEYYRKQIPKYATAFWACSYDAGKWLYSDAVPFEVIPNAIDTSKFKYNPVMREKIRNELGLSEKYIIGNVARFDYQKNQSFLIRVFSEVAQRMPDAVLALVGDGDDRNKIEAQIESLGIKDKILLLGRRNDIYDIINMFDVFVLPSRFEGFGIAAVEAQANGLHCICSNKVPTEVELTNHIDFLPLDHQEWIKALALQYPRSKGSEIYIREAGFDIINASIKLQNQYLAMG